MTLKEFLKETKDYITFDAKNAEEIMAILVKNGYETNQDDTGKLTVIINNEEVTILKGDTIEFTDKNIKIVKPRI